MLTTPADALRPTAASAPVLETHLDADPHWQTLLFMTPAKRDHRSGMSPRLTFQLVLHGRAVIVDARDDAQRADEGEIDASLTVVTDLAAATRTGVATVVVIGDPEAADAAPGTTVVRLDGGVPAWAAAGLPMANQPLPLAA